MDVTGFTGLIIDAQHEQTINSFSAPPTEYCAVVEDLPDEWYPELPQRSQKRTNSCFPAGTMIRMASGEHVPIEDVRILDTVSTAEGRSGTVTKTMIRKHSGEIIRLRLWGHSHLVMTPEHPVLTERGYVDAGNLVEGDWVVLPMFADCFGMKEKIFPGDFCEQRYYLQKENLRNSSTVRGRKHVIIHRRPLPDEIKMTREFGRIVGLFLAEGSTSKHQVIFTFHANESDTIAQEVCDFMTAAGAGLRKTIRDNTTKVVIDGGNWSHFFSALCDTGAGRKGIGAPLRGGPREFYEGVLSGWLDGDGSERRGGQKTGITISKKLKSDMFDLANSLGLRPSVSYMDQPATHGAKHRHRAWAVFLPIDSQKDTYRSRLDGSRMLRKVVAIEAEKFDGLVFNLTVEGDNSYVAEGIGVHNCAGHAEARGFEHEQMVETGTHIAYSPWFCYRTSQKEGGFDGQDGGTSITSTIMAATKHGACLELLCPNPGRNDRSLSSSEYKNSYPSQAAFADAANHKHLGGLRVDLRNWDAAWAWITDLRSIIIGTKWMGGQTGMNSRSYTETASVVNSGNFLGYHARCCRGWKSGMLWCDNSHGEQYGLNGKTLITPEAWAVWGRDPNFFALGFGDTQERVPPRRIWTKDDIKRSGRGSAFRKAAKR